MDPVSKRVNEIDLTKCILCQQQARDEMKEATAHSRSAGTLIERQSIGWKTFSAALITQTFGIKSVKHPFPRIDACPRFIGGDER